MRKIGAMWLIACGVLLAGGAAVIWALGEYGTRTGNAQPISEQPAAQSRPTPNEPTPKQIRDFLSKLQQIDDAKAAEEKRTHEKAVRAEMKRLQRGYGEIQIDAHDLRDLAEDSLRRRKRQHD